MLPQLLLLRVRFVRAKKIRQKWVRDGDPGVLVVADPEHPEQEGQTHGQTSSKTEGLTAYMAVLMRG